MAARNLHHGHPGNSLSPDFKGRFGGIRSLFRSEINDFAGIGNRLVEALCVSEDRIPKIPGRYLDVAISLQPSVAELFHRTLEAAAFSGNFHPRAIAGSRDRLFPVGCFAVLFSRYSVW